MSNVLLTGGAGFIGSHLVDRLLQRGDVVTVVDDLSTGHLENLNLDGGSRESLTFERCDIRDPRLLDVMAAVRPDKVAHLAAQMDVRHSVADPLHDAAVNVLGTVNLLEGCRQAGTGTIVFTTSGGCIYGEPDPSALPVDETYPAHPHSPYGTSKLAGEEYLRMYGTLHGLRWTSLALGNVLGPRQDPAGEAGVVSIFAGLMLAGRAPTIFGDGHQTRDFVYVDDVVDALVASLDAPIDDRVNIGTGKGTSVLELYAQLAEIMGFDQPPVHAPPRAGELQHISLDVSAAAEALAWRPRTPLRQGLASTAEWVQATAATES